MENEPVEAQPPGRVVIWIRRFPLVSFFALSYAISLGFRFLYESAEDGRFAFQELWILYWVSAFGPALAAVLVTGATNGLAGIRQLLSRLLVWRAGVQWWLVAILMYPAMILGAIVLASVFAGTPLEFEPGYEEGALAFWVEIGACLLLAVGEEIGWRAFALPRLLARKGPFAASVYLAVLWGPWHLSGFQMPLLDLRRLTAGLGFLLYLIPISILLTWVYRGVRGSVLVVSVLHASHNLSKLQFAPLVSTPSLLVGIVLSLLQWGVAMVVMIRGGWFRRSAASSPFVVGSPPSSSDAGSSP